MKYVIFILSFFVLTISLSAQNEYRTGDVLHPQLVSFKSYQKMDGKNLLWNMEGSKVLKYHNIVSFVSNRDSTYKASLSRLESGTNYRYDIQNDSVLIKGFKNKMVYVKFDQPETYMRLPLRYNDEVNGFFCGKGEDIMGHFVRIFGKYDTKVCGQGTLITLNGDTLSNTLLVHTHRQICSFFSDAQELFEKYLSLDSVPSLSLLEIQDLMGKDSDAMVLDDYQWFAPGYRYALLHTVRAAKVKSPNSPIFQNAFYDNTEDQANLSVDVENEAVRQSVYKSKKSYNSDLLDENVYSKFFLGEDVSLAIKSLGNGLDVSMDYQVKDNGKCSLMLYNLSGMQLYHADTGFHKNGRYNKHFIICDLSKGVYIITVTVNGKTCSKKVSKC